jgi:unsaturated rhamnogalacturonyl hydrolase
MFFRGLIAGCLFAAATASALAEVRPPAEAREPAELATQLRAVYGRQLESNSYIPALALIGSLETAPDSAQELARVQQLARPYLSGQRQPSTRSPSDLAGHLLFAELARRSKEQDRTEWIELVVRAAATVFEDGDLDRPQMPRESELSDAVFMVGPLLCEAGSLTGDPRYYSAAIDYLQAMRALCLRSDGLYRHWVHCDAAWGRGNGFPAIGVARCLRRLPSNHPGRAELLAAYRDHLDALLPWQAESGCWHQVVDMPESFQELTATCMIGWALEQGLQEGWVEGEQYRSAADRAWAYSERAIASDGQVRGACESTGGQRSMEDYLQRKAIHGIEPRAGAMALLLCSARMSAAAVRANNVQRLSQ